MRNPNCSGKHTSATTWQLSRTETMFRKMYRADAKVEQKSRCVYCKDWMIVATAEHLQPRNRGGSTVRKNIKAACQPCNTAKGNGTDSWFKNLLHQRDMPLHETALAMAWIRFRLNGRIQRSEKRIRKLIGMTA